MSKIFHQGRIEAPREVDRGLTERTRTPRERDEDMARIYTQNQKS